MAFNIKNEEADRLARDLISVTGESLTEAVAVAVRERLDRLRRASGGDKRARIERHVAAFAELPVLDRRSSEEILGYDEHGLPS